MFTTGQRDLTLTLTLLRQDKIVCAGDSAGRIPVAFFKVETSREFQVDFRLKSLL